MERPRPRLYLACGLTLGVIAALLLIPATSSIVRTQAGMVVPISPPAATLYVMGVNRGLSQNDIETLQRRVKEYCSAHPDDYRVQLAAALNSRFNSGEKVANMEALEGRFSQNPSLYANLLRFEAQGRVAGCRRPDGDAVLAEPGSPQPTPTEQKPNPYLEEFDRFAARGEELEPDNAYFPFMRSIGQFAGHGDDEAVESLVRASGKPKWEEHYDDELYGQWKIMDDALGEHGGIPRTAVGAALLFPQYAALRSSARMSLATAVKMEQAGDKQRGFIVRRALARCGDMMRADGKTLICNLVGIAITSIARSRPGGEPYVKLDSKLSAEEKQRINLDKYCSYMVNIGHSEEAERARKMANADQALRSMVHPLPHAADWSVSLLRLGEWWMFGIFLLTNTCWMLAAGAAAYGLSRAKSLRGGSPLPKHVTWALTLTIVLAVAIPAEFVYNVAWGELLAWTTGIGLALALIGSFAFNRPAIRRGLLAMLAAGLVLGGIAAVITWQSQSAMAIPTLMAALYSGQEGGDNELAVLSRIAMTLSYLPIIPLIAAAVFGLASLTLKVPVAAGIVRSFRGLAVPTACLLALLYAATTVGSARHEAAHAAGMERWIQGEGRYIAEIMGRSWEERVE